jgi:hypothetical protein
MNLLQNKFNPITKEVGFLECDIETTAAAYHSWTTEFLHPFKMRNEANDIKGNLETVLHNLLPRTTPTPCRFAFVPTKSNWTAYFDNSRLGTDSSGVIHVLTEKLNCRGIRAVYVLNTLPRKPSRETQGSFGAVIFEVYQNGKAVRTLYAANDGGKWKFGQSGAAFPFEEIQIYSAKKISERFTGKMLDDYLQSFGIMAFDENFYTLENRAAILFHRRGQLPANLKEVETP